MRDYSISTVGKHCWATASFYHLTFGLGLNLNACTLWRCMSVTLTAYLGPFQASIGWHK